MVSNKKQIEYVLTAIAAIGAKAEKGVLNPAVNVNTNRNGVGKGGGPVFRRLGGGYKYRTSDSMGGPTSGGNSDGSHFAIQGTFS